MKMTLVTAFAIALIVVASNVSPAQAIGDVATCYDEYTCNKNKNVANVDELQDPDRTDNERDIADSGNEGSTSAASASD